MPSKIIVEIEGIASDVVRYLFQRGASTVTEVAAGVGGTYAHVVRTVEKLEKMSVVKAERRGRTKVVELTEIGREIGTTLERLNMLVEIARIETELRELYNEEIRGKLREQINKEKVLKKLAELNEKLEPLIDRERLFGLKLRSKIEETEKEVKGIVVG